MHPLTFLTQIYVWYQIQEIAKLQVSCVVEWWHDDAFPIDSAFVSAMVVGFAFAFVTCASQWSGIKHQKKPKKWWLDF